MTLRVKWERTHPYKATSEPQGEAGPGSPRPAERRVRAAGLCVPLPGLPPRLRDGASWAERQPRSGAKRSEAQRLRPAELREAAAWAAPRAGEAPASLRYPLPRADSRGNRPKGELVRPRLPPRRPHPLPRRIRPPSGCCPPTPGLGASPPAPARRFPRSSHSEGFCPLALCRGEAPSLRHPSLTLRGKGVGWGQAKKGGSPRLS